MVLSMAGHYAVSAVLLLPRTYTLTIGDYAMTSSKRIAQVFPELVGKKTHAIWKVYGGMLKYIIHYAFYLARYDAYFHINDDARKCRYLSVTNNFIFSHNLFKLLTHEVL